MALALPQAAAVAALLDLMGPAALEARHRAERGNGGAGDSDNTAAGANGKQWDDSHGSGGGGNGGLYGAGGGGGGYVNSGVGSAGGKGADGLIVITYTP